MGDELLVQKERYLENGVHIGMPTKTKDMERFIYRTLANGLTVLNLGILDERIRAASRMIASKENVLVISRKIKRPIERFASSINAKAIIGRFMPGSLTNPNYENFFEPDVVLLLDPFIDKQGLKEAIKIRVPIIALCNTFNQTSFIDLVIPCNNKGKKAVAFIFYLLTREVLKLRNEIKSDEEFKLKLEDFIEPKEKS
ncbi:MAG: 30S ribosomal protein S2 [Candidatus Aenigmatarchaeota archaeon]